MSHPKFFDRYFDLVEFEPNLRAFIMDELSSPARHWHGLVHHSIMLNEVASYARTVRSGLMSKKRTWGEAFSEAMPGLMMAGDIKTGITATFFHDIVYDATCVDNEEASVATMKLWLDPDKYAIATIEKWILATKTKDILRFQKFFFLKSLKKHELRLIDDWGLNNFIIADMCILWTQNPTLYAFYANGIRSEYHHVPNDQYRAGRAAVLEELRKTNPQDPQIDVNIDWEISRLKEGAYDL